MSVRRCLDARLMEAAMVYSHGPLIEFHCRNHTIRRPIALQRFEGIKMFLGVCAQVPGVYVPSLPVDEIWHDFLMFTEDYCGFCNTQLGCYIHHRPVNGDPPSGYLATRVLLEQLAGPLDSVIWPIGERRTWSEAYKK